MKKHVIDWIEQHIMIGESEKLKCALRIFGLDKSENENLSLELMDITSMVSARKVGQTGKCTRLVIVKFKDANDKFVLRKYRNKLREN